MSSSLAQPAPLPGRQCLLEWAPFEKDRMMGLNHQLASISCALSEAFYLGRMFMMPDRMCLFGLHTERWPGAPARPPAALHARARSA